MRVSVCVCVCECVCEPLVWVIINYCMLACSEGGVVRMGIGVGGCGWLLCIRMSYTKNIRSMYISIYMAAAWMFFSTSFRM